MKDTVYGNEELSSVVSRGRACISSDGIRMTREDLGRLLCRGPWRSGGRRPSTGPLLSSSTLYSCYLLHAPFDQPMSSDHSSSLIESLKDEESPRPHTPSLALAELAGSEPAQTQERPLFRRAKFAIARKFPGTYRVTSKALLYLRGPRPKRDLDRGSRLQHPIVRRSNPFANSGTCSTNTFPVFGVALQ